MTKCSRCGKETELHLSSFCRVCDQEHEQKMKEFMRQLQDVQKVCQIGKDTICDDFNDWREKWMKQREQR